MNQWRKTEREEDTNHWPGGLIDTCIIVIARRWSFILLCNGGSASVLTPRSKACKKLGLAVTSFKRKRGKDVVESIGTITELFWCLLGSIWSLRTWRVSEVFFFFFHGDTSITTTLKLLVRAIQNPKKQGKVREKTKTFLCAVTLLEIHRQVIISN